MDVFPASATVKALNEKKKRITEAEAAAQEIELAAAAKAFKTKIEAEAKAKAIDAEGEALNRNPKLIDMRAVERWDGVLPRIITGEEDYRTPRRGRP